MTKTESYHTEQNRDSHKYKRVDPKSHLNARELAEIVSAYRDKLIPVMEISKEYHLSRVGVYKALKRCGVDTSKNKIPVSCESCGATTYRHRSQIRRSKHLFCNQDCYTAWLNAGGRWTPNRHGSRLARVKVKDLFQRANCHFGNLYVVHHKDGNQANNMLSNLMVFANQGDHVRYHRDCIEPFLDYPIQLWDGDHPAHFR